MTAETNENFQRFLTHLKNYGGLERELASHHPNCQAFREKFPLSRLTQLSLDEYCVGKKLESFCWWIERKLEVPLGRYMPGTARGHRIYFEAGGEVYKHKQLANLSDQEALEYTLKIQACIAGADPQSDLRWLDSDAQIYQRAQLPPLVTVAEGRKLRLVSVYHPDEVLPISSSQHLGHFLSVFGIGTKDIPPVNQPMARMQRLMEFFDEAKKSVPGLSTLGFTRGLYDEALGLAPSDQDQADEREDASGQLGAEEDDSAPALNQILYGPPGTGKTYATVDAALRILDPGFLKEHAADRESLTRRFRQLSEAQRVQFVTFHQSFSYEDFVEGLRAEVEEESKQLRYPITDGVFKSICRAAASKVVLTAEVDIDIAGRRIWKMSLGNTLGPDWEIFEECISGGYILLGWGGGIDFEGCEDRQDVVKRFTASGVTIPDANTDYQVTSVTTFVARMRVGDLVVISDGNFKFRAIGEITGNYKFKAHSNYADDYSQSRSVRWLREYKPSLPHTELMNNQFSQMTLYELKPGSIDVAKLKALLGDSQPRHSLRERFRVGQRFGARQDYVVIRLGHDLMEMRKPNGNVLPLAFSLVETLLTAVEAGKISIDDIQNKSAVGKLNDPRLEPHLVNGYNTILAPLVQHALASSDAQDRRSIESDRRVLIIDEINRGNVSKIFGELITLIEPSKREDGSDPLSVTLPYSREKFTVPGNVYLIGTMNTADRSLTGLDIALRRRFVFREMAPQPGLLEGVKVEGLDIGLLLGVLNERIEALLDREHCLGHAYFLPLKRQPEFSKLRSIFRDQIIPLLQEYFFEDWQRIRWVLNDHRKIPPLQFVQSRPMDVAALFGDKVNVSSKSRSWHINREAFSDVRAYWGIVDHLAAQ